MRCKNCGAENDKQNIVCLNCGTVLQKNDFEDFLKNKKKLLMLSASVIAVIVAIVIILSLVIFPAFASAKMRSAFDSKSGAQVMDVFVDYCSDYSVVYDELSRSGKAAFNEFEDCISDVKDDMNEQPVDTDINYYLKEKTGDIFLPQDYSAVTTIAQYNGELYNVARDFYMLYNSKCSYNLGSNAYSTADYSIAVGEFSSVIESDSWYEYAQSKLTECQEKLLEEKINLIDNYINSGDYESALQQVSNLRNENLTDEMTSKIDEYETKIYEAQLSKIDDYINEGDIDGAREYVETLGANVSEDAKLRLEQAMKNKAVEYLIKADETLKSGERQGAYDMAAMAQTLCPNDIEIQKKVDYYKEYLPLELYEEENYLSQKKGEGYVNLIYYNMKCTSNNSQAMRHCIYVSYDSSAVSSSNLLYSITYNLGKKYNKISGEQFVLYDSRNKEQNGYFEIYGDGKKIFTSDILGVNYLPKNFTVDVNGISTLNIKYYGDTDYSDLMLGTVQYGISNFVATKDLPE